MVLQPKRILLIMEFKMAVETKMGAFTKTKITNIKVP
jgi:hypothetical protein